MICENHDCGENVTIRYPVYRGRLKGGMILMCYECYSKWLKEIMDEEISVSRNED